MVFTVFFFCLQVTNLLQTINYSCDFVLYFILNIHFRQTLLEMFRCCGKKHRRKFAEQSVKDRTQSIRLTTHHNSLRAPAFSLASVWEAYSYWTELRSSDSLLTTTLWGLLPSHWLLYERHVPIGPRASDSILTTTLWELLPSHWLLYERHVPIGPRASDSPLTTTLWELLPSHWLLYERHVPIGQNSEHQTQYSPQLSEDSCFLIGFCVRHVPIGQNSEHQTHHSPQLSEDSCLLIGFCVRDMFLLDRTQSIRLTTHHNSLRTPAFSLASVWESLSRWSEH